MAANAEITPLYDSSVEVVNWSLQADVTLLFAPGIPAGGTVKGGYKTKRIEGSGDLEDIRDLGNEYAGTGIKIVMTVDSIALIKNALRVAGVLPRLQFQAGFTDRGWLHKLAILNGVDISWGSPDGEVEITFEWLALQGTLGTGALVQNTVTVPAFMASGALVTIGAADLVVVKANFGWKNNYKIETSASVKAAGYTRDGTHFQPGREQHTLKLGTRKPLGGTPVADNPTTTAIVITLTDPTGVNSITFTYAAVSKDGSNWDLPIIVTDLPAYECGFMGKKGAVVITSSP